ncbi:HbrB-like-domain-containing protein [Cokeromyces recurvatus]|uniref:HbrB-like-domain-containing protein n=1 Tax=Cokeromyces recurvatus TaxID=90255 RepID=UPI00221FED1E|nr:HbrB-like-domain-containing protein [Cokeromyces recurvatus]KAI7900052.1 HbrB-like-domain-containing protein [Cokeromyces recurvatus]
MSSLNDNESTSMQQPQVSDDNNDKTSAILSSSSNSSSSLSTSLDSNNLISQGPNPIRSQSATTFTIQSPPSGNESQLKRHSIRSNSVTHQYSPRQQTTISTNLDKSLSPIYPPSIHKSLTSLDAKLIARDMEKSSIHLRGDDVTSPTSPINNNNFFLSNSMNGGNNMSFQTIAAPSTTAVAYSYHRQNSMSSTITLPTNYHTTTTAQGDTWQTLCVRVLPLFNGEGVQSSIEDLNELLRCCLTDPISPTLYRDIEALLRDGMFTLNAKMFGVTDEKLLDRLVEQWSFFFTYALPYFEAVFLPLRTDIRYRSADEAEMWNVRNMALRSFRDNVILLQTKRLEDVFNKLFTDFGSSQNPAATAAKMLQMTSLLASSPDHNEEIERVLSNLKANWKIMMTKGDRRGFAGVIKARPMQSDTTNHNIFSTLK